MATKFIFSTNICSVLLTCIYKIMISWFFTITMLFCDVSTINSIWLRYLITCNGSPRSSKKVKVWPCCTHGFVNDIVQKEMWTVKEKNSLKVWQNVLINKYSFIGRKLKSKKYRFILQAGSHSELLYTLTTFRMES